MHERVCACVCRIPLGKVLSVSLGHTWKLAFWLSSFCTVGVWAPGYLWPHTHSLSRASFEWTTNMVCRRGCNMLSRGIFLHKCMVWREIKGSECLLVTVRKTYFSPQSHPDNSIMNNICMYACMYVFLCPGVDPFRRRWWNTLQFRATQNEKQKVIEV